MNQRSPQRIQLFHNPSEITAGTRGASIGPQAIRVAAWKKGSSFYQDHPPIPIPDQNHLLDRPTDTPYAKRIEGLVEIYRATADAVQGCLEKNAFPLIVAGDHGSAGGSISGIAQAHPDKRIGVIWIDAHADLHSPYSTPSGNMHGMPLAAALGLDQKEEGDNEPDDRTAKYWETLKHTGGDAPILRPEDVHFIGLRDMEEAESRYIQKHSIPNAGVSDVRAQGPKKIAEDVLDYLSACDILYISYDVDSLDPTLSHGTGTPVENGLTEEEALELNRHLLRDPRLQCLELVEVNPTLDETGNRMAESAFHVLEQLAEIIEKP